MGILDLEGMIHPFPREDYDQITALQAENADEWSYQRGLEGGWIPKDPTERLYPDICS